MRVIKGNDYRVSANVDVSCSTLAIISMLLEVYSIKIAAKEAL